MNQLAKKVLYTLFKIDPSEIALANTFFLLSFIVGLFFTLFSSVSESMFLNHFSGETVRVIYPWVYIGSSLTGILILSFYGQLAKKIKLSSLFIVISIFLATVTLFLRLMLFTGYSWVYFCTLLWSEVASIFILLLYYSFTGSFFNIQKAKRIYPYLAGGKSLGIVLGGALIVFLLKLSSIENILLMAIVSLLLISLVVFLIDKNPNYSYVSNDEKKYTSQNETLKSIFRSKYVLLIIGFTLLIIFCETIIYYQMMMTLKSTFSEKATTEFLGRYYGYLGLAELLFQFFIMRSLFRTFTIEKSLIILPLITIILNVFLIYNHGLLMSASTAFCFQLLFFTLYDTGVELLVLPLSTSFRMYVTKMLHGIFNKISIMFASIFLIIFTYLAVNLSFLPIVVICIASISVLLLYFLNKEYKLILIDSIEQSYLTEDDLTVLFSKSKINTFLPKLLSIEDADLTVFILTYLNEVGHSDMIHYVIHYVYSENELVAMSAIKLLECDQKRKYLSYLNSTLKDPRSNVKAQAIKTKCHLGREKAYEEVLPFISSNDQIIKGAVIESIGIYCGEKGHATAIEELLKYIDIDIFFVLRVMGRIGKKYEVEFIKKYLDESKGEVLRAVIIAGGQTNNSLLIPSLFENIKKGNFVYEVINSLMNIPVKDTYFYMEVLKNPQYNELEKITVLRILTASHNEKAIISENDMLAIYTSFDWFADSKLLRNIQNHQNLLYSHFDVIKKHENELIYIINNLTKAYVVFNEKNHPMADIIRDFTLGFLTKYFTLLSMHHGTSLIEDTEARLHLKDERLHANALELLEHLLEEKNKSILEDISLLLSDTKLVTGKINLLSRQFIISLLKQGTIIAEIVAIFCIKEGLSEIQTLDEIGMENNFSEYMSLFYDITKLKKIELFHGVSSKTISKIASMVFSEKYLKGEILFKDGDQANSMYFIETGKISIIKNNIQIAELGEGECIGELAILDNMPRSASAVVEENCKVLVIKKKDFEYIMLIDPELSRSLLTIISHRLRNLLEKGNR